MADLYGQADSNIRKTWLYLLFFSAFVLGVAWLIIAYLLEAPFEVFYFVLFFVFLLNFFSYWYSDRIVLALSKAKEIKKEDNPELYRLVENLCITAGLPLPRIYIIEESQPNAFATGRNPKKGVIAVTRGLLERLDRSELEGVIAHELAHIGNRDILLSTIVVVLVGVVVLITDFFFRFAFWGGGRRSSGGKGNLFVVLLALGMAILAPILATMMRMAISRRREYLADVSGALLTRYPEGLAGALEKIASDPHPLRAGNDATAHLYIVNPMRGKESKAWLHKLFLTHPPVEDRIKKLREINV